MWFRIVLLILALGSFAPAVAVAQDDSARAIELISQANKSYDAGDFRSALEKYREAYTITEDPRVLYRIGITYENLANYQRAREHLELYLLAEPNSKYAGRVKSKIENLRNLEANLQSAVRIDSQPTAANVWVDTENGRPSGVTPVRIPLGPGQHTLLIRKEGFEDVRDNIEVGTGETLEKTYDLGSGSPVAENSNSTQTPTETTETKTETTPAPVVLTGEPTHVRVGPSTGLAVFSWLCVAAGVALMATSGVYSVGGPFYANGTLIGSGFFLGAGLAVLGGYFLWFRDYKRDLPPALSIGPNSVVPNQRVVGIGLRF